MESPGGKAMWRVVRRLTSSNRLAASRPARINGVSSTACPVAGCNAAYGWHLADTRISLSLSILSLSIVHTRMRRLYTRIRCHNWFDAHNIKRKNEKRVRKSADTTTCECVIVSRRYNLWTRERRSRHCEGLGVSRGSGDRRTAYSVFILWSWAMPIA